MARSGSAEISPGTRPLVMRWGSFGDLVMLTPVLKALSQRAGEPVDLVAAGPWSETMFLGSPWVHRVWSVMSTTAPHWLDPSKRRVLHALRNRARGPFWVIDTGSKAYRFCDATRWPREAMSIGEADLPATPVPHAIDYFWARAMETPSAFDLPPLVRPDRWCWELPPPEGAAEDCERWLGTLGAGDGPIICLQAGNKRTMRRGRADRSSNVKHWPDENWLALTRGLHELEPDAHVLLLGAPVEAELTERLAALSNDRRVISVARDMTIPRLLALLQRALGLVSVDTGTAHAAAATGCPAVVLFGPTDPRRVGPKGERVSVVHPPLRTDFDWRDSPWQVLSMTDIRPAAVIEAWQELWREDGKQQKAT